ATDDEHEHGSALPGAGRRNGRRGRVVDKWRCRRRDRGRTGGVRRRRRHGLAALAGRGVMLAARVLPGRRREARPELEAEAEELADGARHEVRPAERGEAEVGICRRPERVVDLGDHVLRAERLGRQLAGHDVPVVALGHRDEQVGIRRPGPPQRVFVGPVAAHGGAAEGARQAVEGGRGGVDDDHLVAGSVEAVGEDRADPATPDDHGFHWFSSWIGSRTTQTAQGAFFRTYGIVRPIAKSPPNLVRYARPTTSRSASRSSASSTSAAPTSRAWSSTDSSVTPAASAVPSARSSTCWISSDRPATSTSSGIDQSTSTTWTPISSALLAFASSATRRMSRMPFG